MTTATIPPMDITDRLSEIEKTTNKGFREIAGHMGSMATMIERTGARFIAEGNVSEKGVSIEFKLVFDNVVPNRSHDISQQVDVTMVTEFARVFGERFLNR